MTLIKMLTGAFSKVDEAAKTTTKTKETENVIVASDDGANFYQKGSTDASAKTGTGGGGGGGGGGGLGRWFKSNPGGFPGLLMVLVLAVLVGWAFNYLMNPNYDEGEFIIGGPRAGVYKR